MRRRMQQVLRSTAVTLIAVVAALLLDPDPGAAQWDDRSDELPGYDISATTIIIGAVVVVGAVFLIRHLTRDDDGEDEATEEGRAPGAGLNGGMIHRIDEWPADTHATAPIPLDLMIGTRRGGDGASSVVVGVRLRLGSGGTGTDARK